MSGGDGMGVGVVGEREERQMLGTVCSSRTPSYDNAHKSYDSRVTGTCIQVQWNLMRTEIQCG